MKKILSIVAFLILVTGVASAQEFCDADLDSILNITTINITDSTTISQLFDVTYLGNGTYSISIPDGSDPNVTRNYTFKLNCTSPIRYFNLNNVTWNVSDKKGTVFYNINMNALYPVEIKIISDDIFKEATVFSSSNVSIPLFYDIENFTNYTDQPLNISFNNTTYTIYYNLTVKDINLPRINNVIYPLDVKTGNAFSIFVDAYDNWFVKNVYLKVKDIRLPFNEIDDTHYSIDRQALEIGEYEFEIEVVDAGGNKVKQNITITFTAKDYIYVKSLNVPALAVNRDYEGELFVYDEVIPFKVMLTKTNWQPDIPTYPTTNQTNQTNQTNTTITPYPPSILFSVNDELREIAGDLWYEFESDKINLYVLGKYRGILDGEVHFDFPSEYKVLNNVSYFNINFKNYTLLPQQKLEMGGRIGICDLVGEGQDIKYRCWTDFPTTIDLQSVGTFFTQFDIASLNSKCQSDVNTVKTELKFVQFLNNLFMSITGIIIIVLFVVYAKYFSGLKVKW